MFDTNKEERHGAWVVLVLYGVVAAVPPLACLWMVRALESGSGPHSGMGAPLFLGGLAFAGLASLALGLLGTVLVIYGVVRMKMHGPFYGQVLIFLSNLRMVPRARLSCWFLRRAFGEELVSKFLDSPDCENIHPYAAPFTRCGQQDCEREFYRGLLGKEVRNDFRPTFEFSEGALE